MKKEVVYDNPLYSTGILTARDSLKKLKGIFGEKYKIENDRDLMRLVEEKGKALLEDIKTEKASRNKRGSS